MRADAVHACWRDLPVLDLDQIMPGTALILAPHADDESLGCGGLIAEACQRGRPPVVAILTDGTGSHPNSQKYPPARLQKLREDEAAQAVAILGLPADRLFFLRARDTAAPQEGPALKQVAQRLQNLAHDHGCTTMLTTWSGDPHCDHLAAARIAERVAADAHLPLLAYPVWGWTLPGETDVPVAAVHGARLAISPHLPRKQAAIAAHRSQYGDLIDDDPQGFRLPSALLRHFEQPYEVFLRLDLPS